MWTYTAYILYRYLREVKGDINARLPFREFSDFMFNVLWLKYGVVFHDSERELFEDILYLKELGIIDIDNDNTNTATITVHDVVKLESIAKTVEQSYAVCHIGLYRIYNERIDKAIKSKAREVCT